MSWHQQQVSFSYFLRLLSSNFSSLSFLTTESPFCMISFSICSTVSSILVQHLALVSWKCICIDQSEYLMLLCEKTGRLRFDFSLGF